MANKDIRRISDTLDNIRASLTAGKTAITIDSGEHVYKTGEAIYHPTISSGYYVPTADITYYDANQSGLIVHSNAFSQIRSTISDSSIRLCTGSSFPEVEGDNILLWAVGDIDATANYNIGLQCTKFNLTANSAFLNIDTSVTCNYPTGEYLTVDQDELTKSGIGPQIITLVSSSTTSTDCGLLYFRKNHEDLVDGTGTTLDSEAIGEIVAVGREQDGGSESVGRIRFAQDGNSTLTRVPGRIEFAVGTSTVALTDMMRIVPGYIKFLGKTLILDEFDGHSIYSNGTVLDIHANSGGINLGVTSDSSVVINADGVNVANRLVLGSVSIIGAGGGTSGDPTIIDASNYSRIELNPTAHQYYRLTNGISGQLLCVTNRSANLPYVAVGDNNNQLDSSSFNLYLCGSNAQWYKCKEGIG